MLGRIIMQPSLLQAHIRAWTLGALWPFPYFALIALGSGLLGPAVLLLYFGFPLLAAYLIARFLGRYDLLTFISFTLPQAYFLVTSMHFQLRESFERHRGLGLTIGEPSVTLALASIFIPAGLGILLKRATESPVAQPATAFNPRPLYVSLSASLLFIVAIAELVLFFDSRSLARKFDPTRLAIDRRETISSPSEPSWKKIQVLLKMENERSSEATQLRLTALHDSQPEVRYAAAACLVASGDIHGLPLMEDTLMKSSHATLLADTPSAEINRMGIEIASIRTEFNLGMSLGSIKDPAAVPILIKLLTSSDAETRRGAAAALRNIRSPQSVDALLQALDDPDPEVRYFTVGALIAIKGDGRYPSVYLYKQHETRFLDPWKKWARDRTQSPPRTELN